MEPLKVVPSERAIGIRPYADQGLKEFLAKPIVIDDITWSTTDTFNTILTSGDINTAIESKALWANKLSGYKYFRGTVVLRLNINASPFQQGRLLLHFLPFATHMGADWVSLHNANMCTKTQQRSVEIDCRDTECVLRIPYVSPYQWYDRESGLFKYGSYYISVLSDLATGTSGQTDVFGTLFLSIEDAEFAGPIVPQGPSKGRRRALRPSNPADSEKSGVVSGIADTIANTSQALGEVMPELDWITGPTTWISDAVANVASIFGFSQPRSEEATIPVMVRKMFGFANYDNTYLGDTLGLSMSNKLELSSSFAGQDLDEMNIDYLKTIPAYVQGLTWQDSAIEGDSLYVRQIVPQNLAFQEFYVGTYTYELQSGPPFVNLARFYQYFRGGVRLHMKVVKTDFHSGRLLLTFSPTKLVNTAPTTQNSAYLFREIIDIRTSNEYVWTLPYLQPEDFITTGQTMGTVSLTVLNRLRAPETVSSGVQVMIWFSAAEDFEFACPKQNGRMSIKPTPQSGVSAKDLGVVKQIGSSEPRERVIDHVSSCMGEVVTSVKQLLLRPNLMNWKWSGVTPLGAGGWVRPFTYGVSSVHATAGTPVGGPIVGDIISEMATMFALSRGSMRFWYPDDGSASFQVRLNQMDASTAVIGNTTNAFLYNDSELSYDLANTGPIVFYRTSVQDDFVACEVPHYGQTPSRLNKIYFGTSTSFNPDPSQPASTVYFDSSTALTAATSRLYRSVGDDFQMGYFCGTVPYCNSISLTPP